MGYSPRYHIYTNEFPGQHSETDDWACVESEMRRAKESGAIKADYAAYVIDTHTGQRTDFNSKGVIQPPCSECATLRKERDDAETNVKDLEKQLAEINAPGYACGLLFGMGQPFVGGCGKEVLQHESYRCADCTASFHRACINDHFESDAYLKALRDERNQQPLKDWKESHAKEKARAEAAEAQLSTHTKTLLHIQKTVKGDWANYLDQIDEVRCTVSAALAPTPEVAPKE